MRVRDTAWWSWSPRWARPPTGCSRSPPRSPRPPTRARWTCCSPPASRSPSDSSRWPCSRSAIPRCSFTGAQVGLVTDQAHTRARIKRITRGADPRGARRRPRSRWWRASRASPRTGDITTLGRGGSDLTGVALAAALKADVCEIFTDVDGVYTADPNVVPDARKLAAHLLRRDAGDGRAWGPRCSQARSVEFAKKYDVPVHVRSTFKPDPGTLVTREDHSMEDVVVTGITHDRGPGQGLDPARARPARASPPGSSAASARRTSWWT